MLKGPTASGRSILSMTLPCKSISSARSFPVTGLSVSFTVTTLSEACFDDRSVPVWTTASSTGEKNLRA